MATTTGRWRSHLLLASVAVVALGAVATEAAAQERVKSIGAIEALGAGGQLKSAVPSPVHEQRVVLRKGVETTFETRELSIGSDPVLHLLSPSGIDIARSDDADGGGTRHSRLTVRPTRTGLYRLVLHAFKPETAGSARIFRNGVAISPTVAFAGWRARVAGIREGESLETVRLPTSGVSRPVLYVFHRDRRRIWRRVADGATGGEPGLEFPFAAGSRHIVLGTRDGNSGATRLVRNDSRVSGHDPDGDGLGSELETEMGTCSRRSGLAGGFDCNRTSDARDTDGDGIRDDWEVLGRRDRFPHQPLPLWGATPRHKDIFVEVDFMRRCEDAASTDRVMSAETARMMAAFYGDRVGPLASPTRRAARALDLENPDGLPGVRLHLDTGLPSPPGETTFGDWGGHSVVPPARDGSGTCIGGQSAATAWGSMARVRRGVFHYVPAYFGGGGQATEWRAYAAFNAGSALNAAHEFGHSLGLGHSGRAGASFADPNCKPTYPSIMNYGYYDRWWKTADVGFSDGRDRPSLINGSLTERGAIDPDDAWYVNHLRTIFDYNVDSSTGDVDWNRNGMFESLTASGYTNYAAGGTGCEWTKYNAVAVPGNSMKSPSVVRLGRATYVFYSRARDGRLAYARTTSRLRCRQPVDGPCDGASFGSERTRAVDATRGVAAVRLRFGTTPTILVTAVSKVGRLRETRLSLPFPGGEAWSSVRAVPGVEVDSEPGFERVSDSTAYLAFAGPDRQLRYRIFSTLGGWSPAGLAMSSAPDGGPPVPLPALPAAAAPGLGWLYLPSQPRTRALYGAFADGAGRLALYRLDRHSGLWHATSDLDSRPVVAGRPAMLWAPTYTTDESIGRVHLHYVDTSGVVRSMTTWSQGIGPASVQRIGLDGPLQNTWFKGRGVSTMYEFGVDSNVRAVIAKRTRDDGTLSFYPNADGITEFPIANHNDWRLFRTSLCRTLMHPTGGEVDPAVATPVRCEPAP